MQSTTPARLAAAAAILASLPLAAATAATSRGATSDRLPAVPAHQRRVATGAAGYSLAVARICVGALLFEQAHAIGTDAGARAAAQDSRRSARRRLDRVAAIPIPPELRSPAIRWISLQRRLAESYATNWLRIHHAIDAARTPRQRAGLPTRLERLLRAADPLRQASERIELAIDVPDCTGGGSRSMQPGNDVPLTPPFMSR
jgi:hypothetical protein